MSCTIDYPEDPYCIVKRTLEAFALTLHKRGVPVKILRPFSGYGPDQSEQYPFRAIFERAMRREDPLTVWGGSQIRDWLWIDDLCGAIMYAIATDAFPYGVPIEIGTGLGTSLKALAQMIASAVGYDPRIACDQLKAQSSSQRIARADVAWGATGWRHTVSLEDGIACAVSYFQKKPSKKLTK